MISIIIPCHNEEPMLEIFFEALTKVTRSMPTSFEYIFVNDGSTDDTLSKIKELYSNKQYSIKYVSFSRNFGKEAAMYAGLKKALGEYVVIMDADLQDPPELLPEMYTLLQNNDLDCIGTRRENRKGESFFRSILSVTFYNIIKILSDTPILQGVRDYRMMSRKMVDAILEMTEYNRFSKGIFSWVGFNTEYISFSNQERVAGETSWNLKNLFSYSIDGIINFSDKPLNIASIIGILSCATSGLALIFIVFRALLFGDATQGWPSMVAIMLFMGGVQLLSLGILGKYIGKIYLETKKRPHYIIKEEGE